MVPLGSNPETYDPTPQQLVTLNKSCAFLRIGYIGFEQAWAEKLQSNAPQVKFFDMSDWYGKTTSTTEITQTKDQSNRMYGILLKMPIS